jgi:hypothetical protein
MVSSIKWSAARSERWSGGRRADARKSPSLTGTAQAVGDHRRHESGFTRADHVQVEQG